AADGRPAPAPGRARGLLAIRVHRRRGTPGPGPGGAGVPGARRGRRQSAPGARRLDERDVRRFGGRPPLAHSGDAGTCGPALATATLSGRSTVLSRTLSRTLTALSGTPTV